MANDSDGIYINPQCRLTAREYRCVELYCKGYDDKLACEALYVTPSTLTRTKRSIKEKVAARTFLQAMLIIAKQLSGMETHKS